MTTTPLPPNKEGATQCIVRWQVETSAGWLGAYNKDAFEAYDTQARADLEAENKRLREALNDAATSLETIQLRSYGEDSGLSTLLEVRGYAGNRAKMARAALKETP